MVNSANGSHWRIQGERSRPPPPPQGYILFRFDIKNFQNIATLGVGAPYEVGAPFPTENSGSATDSDTCGRQLFWFGEHFPKYVGPPDLCHGSRTWLPNKNS